MKHADFIATLDQSPANGPVILAWENSDGATVFASLPRQDVRQMLVDFKEQHLCSFDDQIQQEADLIDLVREYFRQTEDFDQSICTGGMSRHGDGAMPATAEQRRLINRNAIQARQALGEQAEQKGYTPAQLGDMLRRFNRHPYWIAEIVKSVSDARGVRR
ncbi:hypothetical protein [Polaromonas naphthalenivorans]|uniref:hypothetical protein n=1 Tax=Polaromonas naphthalenivorans TaxID=216465 RepID=UPI00059B76CC|nr:hypothetical protein [Polaromonas naphthalenivorans]